MANITPRLRYPDWKHFICALLAVAVLAGCAQTKQASKLEDKNRTGFLGDYSSLQKGKDEQALLRYVKPDVNFSKYQAAIIDPVTVWTGSGSNLAQLSPAERQKMADRFYAHLTKQIGQVMPLTTQVQPGVLRIQVALTDASKSQAALDTVSTVMPVGLAASVVKESFTGKASFTGSTSMEIKISDAQTGEILAAAVDKRVGSKSLDTTTFKSWADTDAAMKYWAELLAYRICQRRGQSGCMAPEA